MKGLIIKDVYMTLKYFRSFLVLVLVFLAASIVNGDNMFFVVYPMLMSTMIPMTLLSYDEKFRWNVYCGALPCSRAQYVSGKYLLCLFSMLAVLLLSFAAQLIRQSGNGGSLSQLRELMSLLLSLGLIAPSLLLPVVFKLGVERGRIAYHVILSLICALGVLAPSASGMSLSLGASLLPLAAVLIFGASWLLSIQLYKSRSL